MADTKISALDANSTLDFTEVVPIVQGGVTKKMALSQLAGRLFARSAGLWYPLAFSAQAVTLAADTNENTAATIAIPAGAMGANGILRVWSTWRFTNGADDKIIRLKLGSTDIAAFTITTQATLAFMRMIHNVNNQAVQKASFNANNTNSLAQATSTTFASATENTAGALNLLLTGQKETGGDTLILESYLVELLYAA